MASLTSLSRSLASESGSELGWKSLLEVVGEVVGLFGLSGTSLLFDGICVGSTGISVGVIDEETAGGGGGGLGTDAISRFVGGGDGVLKIGG